MFRILSTMQPLQSVLAVMWSDFILFEIHSIKKTPYINYNLYIIIITVCNLYI